MPDEPQSELTSWKEVAEYLGVTTRTAQKWEREKGLPVRRITGGRGRISADVAALAAWRHAVTERPKFWTSITFLQKYSLVATALFLISAGALSGLWLKISRAGPPSYWRLEGNTLIVSDNAGRVLWRKHFDKRLEPSAYVSTALSMAPKTWFGDLDGDDRREMLFWAHPAAHTERASELICFSDRGDEKWRFVPGRTVSTPKETFHPPFMIRQFAVVPPDATHGSRVLVTGHQLLYYPNQVALLSARGEILREYWHSGAFFVVSVDDFNGDGRDEIYLGGVSNSYKQATLVVLDPDTMSGASVEENESYQLQGFEPGREIARLLFPRTCFNRKYEPYNFVSQIHEGGDYITVDVMERPNRCNALYDLSPELKLIKLDIGDYCRKLHEEMEAAGQLDHPFTQEEFDALKDIRVFRSTQLAQQTGK